MRNSLQLFILFPALAILVSTGFGEQNKSSDSVKPVDNTVKWELPYEAPPEKSKRIQDGIKSIKLRMSYAQAVSRLGTPDAVYDLRNEFFGLSPQEDGLMMSYRSSLSFRVIWYFSKAGTAPNLKDKWFALYLATDEKTVLARMANNLELPKLQ